MLHSLKLKPLTHPITTALLLLCLFPVSAQEQRYFYDETGQLTKSIDASGIAIEYLYDEVGNRLETRRSLFNGLTIFNFSPSRVAPGDSLTIEGQHFSAVANQNSVTINTIPATVTAASTTQLTITVPASATTGPLAVEVDSVTANSDGFVYVILPPVISSVTPNQLVSNPTVDRQISLTIGGNDLTASTFQITPEFEPPLLSVDSASINQTGDSATLDINLTPDMQGSYTLIATNSEGQSDPFNTTANSFSVLAGSADADNDGLSNFAEEQAGTDLFNPDSDGDGFSDGVEVADGGDPNDPNSLPEGLFNGIVAQRISIQNTAIYTSNTNRTKSVRTKPLSIQNQAWVFVDSSGTNHTAVTPLSVSNQALVFKAADGSGDTTTANAPISINNETFPWAFDGKAAGPDFTVENQQ